MDEKDEKLYEPPKVLKDTQDLAVLLDRLQDCYKHKHKYGWGNDLQHLTAGLLSCWSKSQVYSDFKKRVEALEDFIAGVNTIYMLLEVMTANAVLPNDKLVEIYRKMGEISRQIRGLKAYFAEKARIQR